MKVALVTGGARGIGAQLSRRLAADGFAVAVNYAASEEAATALVAEITDAGGTACALRADVGDADEAAGLVARAADTLGPPTALVHNAGINLSGSVRGQSPRDWDRVLAVNLSAAFYLAHAALPAMYEQGWGRLVFFTSPAAERHPMPTTAAYAAAKAGLQGMTRALAKETARRGITVNSVLPGYVLTDMVEAEGSDAVAEMDRRWPRIPPTALASTVSFLLSDEAEYVSGEEIGVWRGGPV
ncbi:SDR family NAD(P)-dependent oxidoreductase [Pseudonocardia xishanensis]|uniref:SDR family oxidoreductase n=1 Tax=Pseudonocardia xishanensis TaxID=630995 RepID=A0ABP8RUS8_9PSEU